MMPETLSDMAANVGAPKGTPAEPLTQASAVERQIANYLAAAEKERLRKRAEIRVDIVKRAGLVAELALIDDQLKAIDVRADEAAERHSQATAPIQSKLQTAAGPQRDKLLSQLTDCNIALERELDVLKRVREPLQKRHFATRNEISACKTEMFLISVGKPALLVERFAADRRLQHSQQRVEMARDQLSQLEPALQQVRTTPLPQSSYGHTHVNKPPMIDCELVVHYSRRVSEWRHELLCASQELQDSEQELQRIAAAMVAE